MKATHALTAFNVSLTTCASLKNRRSLKSRSLKNSLNRMTAVLMLFAATVLFAPISTSAQSMKLEPQLIQGLPYFTLTSQGDTLAILSSGQLEELAFATAYAANLLEENETLLERQIVAEELGEAYRYLYELKKEELNALNEQCEIYRDGLKECRTIAIDQKNYIDKLEPKYRKRNTEAWIWRATAAATVISLILGAR